MTSEQVRCLDLYEKELQPDLPPIDRSIELNHCGLAERVCQMRDMFYFSRWPADKIYAAAICYLCFFGYDPQEELEIAKRMKESAERVIANG